MAGQPVATRVGGNRQGAGRVHSGTPIMGVNIMGCKSPVRESSHCQSRSLAFI